jgi:UPF0042 nucleotide-binding protein
VSAADGKRIVVLTGMSGGGKSTAVRALEDSGYFCVDNLPTVLVPKLLELAAQGQYPHIALVVDAREGHFLKDAPAVMEEARRAGHDVTILFLDASDDALLRRFSETRRRHPLAPDSTAAEGIRRERQLLRDLRELADQVVDTSALTVHDLKRLVQTRFAQAAARTPTLSVLSFGFRYGVPPQADLVFDVRFLPNPYFVPELKPLTGEDARVASWVLEREETQAFLEKLVDLCRFLFPRYQREGKAYLTVALGCTGGKHRSVALAAELTRRLAADGTSLPPAWHRDIGKE